MKALTLEQVESYRYDGFPVALSGSHARRDGGVPGRARALRALARQSGAEGRHALAIADPRLPAVLCRPRPQPAHPRRGRGPDRAGHPGVDQHLLHQGGVVADLRRLAPGLDLLRPRSLRAGDGLGGADRRQPGCRLHRGAVGARQAAPDAPRTARSSPTASTAPARPSPNRSTSSDARRCRSRPASSRCIIRFASTARRPTTRRTAGSGSASTTSRRTSGRPARAACRRCWCAAPTSTAISICTIRR